MGEAKGTGDGNDPIGTLVIGKIGTDVMWLPNIQTLQRSWLELSQAQMVLNPINIIGIYNKNITNDYK